MSDTPASNPATEFRIVPVETIIGLRREVLRKNMPNLSPDFPEDREPQTVHFAALSEGVVIACLTVFPSQWQGKNAFQLRGMAVDPARQGQHLGSRLLEFAGAEMAQRSPIRLWWCNAREAAVPFYEKQGWRIASEPFMVEPIGTHFKMVVEYEQSSSIRAPHF